MSAAKTFLAHYSSHTLARAKLLAALLFVKQLLARQLACGLLALTIAHHCVLTLILLISYRVNGNLNGYT